MSIVVLIGRPNKLSVFRGECGERALLIAICCRIRLLPNLGCECNEISWSKSPNDDSAGLTAVFQVQQGETVAEGMEHVVRRFSPPGVVARRTQTMASVSWVFIVGNGE